MDNSNNKMLLNGDFTITNPKDINGDMAEKLLEAGFETKKFNFEENEMSNSNNKSDMALAAEQEIQDVINSAKESELIIVNSDNNIIGFNTEKMMDNTRKNNTNGFVLGTSGEGRTFFVKKDLMDEIIANNDFSESE